MNSQSTRRTALGAMAGAAASLRRAPAAAGKDCNVLFLMSDEHSPHVAGCFGNRIVRTPALDSLAARGAVCTAAYTQNPICVPSRASFLTGRMPSNVGVFGNAPNTLDDSVRTMADVFRDAGYVAAWIGKTHWGGNPRFEKAPREAKAEAAQEQRAARSRLPEEAAVAPWPVEDEVDGFTTRQALDFLERNRGKRFFAGVSFRKPHFPFVVQERYFRMYEGRVPAPRVTPQMIADLPNISREEREKYGFAGLTEPQIRKALAVYYGMVTYMDEQLGMILAKLDRLGLRDNTIVLYTADHGEMGGEHGLWYKNSFYEAAARVPMVWSFPREIPRRTVAAPVMNMDIFPTLCDLCGLEKPAGLEGRSLLPLMKGSEDGSSRYALSENYRGNAAGRMIRSGQWKYCYFKDDREQLFDLKNDPAEAVNLAARPEHRQLAASLKTRALEGWRLDKMDEYRRKARQARKDGVTDEPE